MSVVADPNAAVNDLADRFWEGILERDPLTATILGDERHADRWPDLGPDGRAADEMRPVSLERGVARHAEGSCLVRFGNTHVLCTASLEDRTPPFLRGTGEGWVTAEYGMLPRATKERVRREATAGKQSGRTLEIQRLIGRSLRAVVDRRALGEKQITLDCDVLQADGGDIELVEVHGNSARVRLTGMCSGCPSAHMTLYMGVEMALRDEIKEFEELQVV